MSNKIRTLIGIIIIIFAMCIMALSSCFEGSTLSKSFIIIGMSLLILSMIISTIERKRKNTSSRKEFTLAEKMLLLMQTMILSALSFVIMDVQLKTVIIILLLIAFSLAVIVYYISRGIDKQE